MRKSILTILSGLLLLSLVSCPSGGMKGGEIKSETEWKEGFKTLVDIRNAGASAQNSSSSNLINKDEITTEKYSNTVGFKFVGKLSISPKWLFDGQSYAKTEDFLSAFKNYIDGDSKIDGEMKTNIKNILETTYSMTIEEMFGSMMFANPITMIATPEWEVQYTESGKDEDIVKIGTFSSYTPAALASYYKDGNSWYAEKTSGGDANKEPVWNDWASVDEENDEKSMYEQLSSLFMALHDGFTNAKPDKNFKYTVKLYASPTTGGFSTSKIEGTDEVDVNVWFGEDDKKVKQIEFNGDIAYTMTILSPTGGSETITVPAFGTQVAASLKLTVEYPDKLEYTLPKLPAAV